jgi:hypothetical protein
MTRHTMPALPRDRDHNAAMPPSAASATADHPDAPAPDGRPNRRSRGARRAVAAAAVAACVASLGLGACSSTAGSGSGTGTSAAPTTAAAPSSYASIADLQKALEGKGITCKLEYPGLKDDTAQTELSICVIDTEQAFLKIWLKPDQIKEFLASPDGQTGTVAVGANWTVTVNSNAVADKVAKALGGAAPSGAGSAGGTTGTR